MSREQLETIIETVSGVFNGWGPETSLQVIRQEWDDLFSNVTSVVNPHSERVDAGGVEAEWITAPQARADRIILYLHGGGFVLGSIHSHRDICERLSQVGRARVLALNYRLAPESPFPAQLEDALAAYDWLLATGASANHIAFAGDSAGAGLCLSTMLALKTAARPLPVCAALMSPWVDMEMLGTSLTANDAIDPMVHKPMVEVMVSMFLGEGDRRNPLANPLHGDFAGLPPLLIHVGERETLHDDSIRVAQKATAANVPVELKIWQGQIHVFHIFACRLDEAELAIGELGTFLANHLS